VSHDCAIAVGSVIASLTNGFQLLKVWPATLYEPVQGSGLYGARMCSCIAASAVTGLNVEPGG
jgi:hypothetical protein